MSVLLAFLSLLVELAVGYPDRVFRAIGHPVTWVGGLIGFLDRTLNRAERSGNTRRLAGVFALAALIATAGLAGFLIEHISGNWTGMAVTVVIASALLSQRSLARHVGDVGQALESEGMASGRAAVAKIVGRDTDALDKAGVSRAAIESLAENFSDGIVAPTFWLALLGLPGAAIYKAVNTADSMIGHKSQKYADFGWASARFDDLLNLPASRIAAALLIAGALIVPGASAAGAVRAVLRDAARHRSPNAGWPEAAMAGALGLSLAGPRIYNGVRIDDAMMGEGGRREAGPEDIRRALGIYWTADLLLVVSLGALAAIFMPPLS